MHAAQNSNIRVWAIVQDVLLDQRYPFIATGGDTNSHTPHMAQLCQRKPAVSQHLMIGVLMSPREIQHAFRNTMDLVSRG